MKKKALSALLAAVVALSLAACAAQTETPVETTAATTAVAAAEPKTEPEYPVETVTVGTTAAIETAVYGEYNFDMLASGVSELPLVYQDISGEFHPLLAEFTTEDVQTWTYTIREGMTWSDGEAVTAEDILFTLEYDQANGSANFESQTDDDGKITEAKYTRYTISQDKASISLTLATPNVRELSNMTSFRVMPKHIYEGKESVTEEEARITCGPYVLDGLITGHLPHLGLHGIKPGKLAGLLSAMPRYDLVPPIFLRSERDRGDDPALLDALDKLIHVLIQLHLEGMVREIVDLREGNIINARELVFLSLCVIHEKLIVPGQAQIDFLYALQALSPPL